VVNKVFEGAQLTVAFYVDDLLMSCEDPEGIDWLLHRLKAKFKDFSVTRWPRHSDLGQTLDYGGKNEVKITSLASGSEGSKASWPRGGSGER
jgi:hypothetical protein